MPIKTNQWDEAQPGFQEADTVAHCGSSFTGMFVYMVTVVDIATGWTEQCAVWGKGEHAVLKALQYLEQCLPFQIKGINCDNDSEFLNWHILKYFPPDVNQSSIHAHVPITETTIRTLRVRLVVSGTSPTGPLFVNISAINVSTNHTLPINSTNSIVLSGACFSTSFYPRRSS